MTHSILRPRLPYRIIGAAGLLLTATLSYAGGWSHDFDAAEAESRRTGKPLLIHVHAEWCGPCRQMDARTLHTGEVQRMLAGPVIGVLVNSDHRPDVVRRFGVQMLPADVLVDAKGTVLHRGSGFKSAGAYVSSLAGKCRQSYAVNKPASRPADRGQAARTRPSIASAEPSRRISDSQTPARAASGGTTVPVDLVAPPMLRGFSPVALHLSREWIKGSRDFAVDYRGQTYLMATAGEVETFRANPRRFAPRLLGCDAVMFTEKDRAVTGRVEWAAFYEEELYLFSTEENRRRFKVSPNRFVSTRVVRLHDIETVVR